MLNLLLIMLLNNSQKVINYVMLNIMLLTTAAMPQFKCTFISFNNYFITDKL